MFDPELVKLLACPVCKGSVRLNETGDALTCEHCRLRFSIRDDIPIMLTDEAEAY